MPALRESHVDEIDLCARVNRQRDVGQRMVSIHEGRRACARCACIRFEGGCRTPLCSRNRHVGHGDSVRMLMEVDIELFRLYQKAAAYLRPLDVL